MYSAGNIDRVWVELPASSTDERYLPPILKYRFMAALVDLKCAQITRSPPELSSQIDTGLSNRSL